MNKNDFLVVDYVCSVFIKLVGKIYFEVKDII